MYGDFDGDLDILLRLSLKAWSQFAEGSRARRLRQPAVLEAIEQHGASPVGYSPVQLFNAKPGDASDAAQAVGRLGVKHQQWQHVAEAAGQLPGAAWSDGKAMWQQCLSARKALAWQHSVQGAVGGEGRMLRLALEGLTTSGRCVYLRRQYIGSLPPAIAVEGTFAVGTEAAQALHKQLQQQALDHHHLFQLKAPQRQLLRSLVCTTLSRSILLDADPAHALCYSWPSERHALAALGLERPMHPTGLQVTRVRPGSVVPQGRVGFVTTDLRRSGIGLALAIAAAIGHEVQPHVTAAIAIACMTGNIYSTASACIALQRCYASTLVSMPLNAVKQALSASDDPDSACVIDGSTPTGQRLLGISMQDEPSNPPTKRRRRS